jgi:AcrR family transcriptional regulator
VKNPPANPIARQSQAWLTEALLRLMERKPFSEITVTEIAEKEGLSRRTFYRIFATREEVLTHYADTLYAAFLEQLQARPAHDYQEVMRLYFQFWYTHKSFLMLLKRNDLLPMIAQQYGRYFPEVFRLVKADHPLAHDPEALSYAMAYSAGGLFSLLLRWAENGMEKTPEEMMALVEKAIKQA